MPTPLSDDELDAIVDDAIAETFDNIRDMGRVMADVMPQIAGRADGSAVSQWCARSSPEPATASADRCGGRRESASSAASVLAYTERDSSSAPGRRPAATGAAARSSPPGRAVERRGSAIRDAASLAPVQATLDISQRRRCRAAGIGDGILETLRERLDCTIRLRGNQLTLEGEDSSRSRRRGM